MVCIDERTHAFGADLARGRFSFEELRVGRTVRRAESGVDEDAPLGDRFEGRGALIGEREADEEL